MQQNIWTLLGMLAAVVLILVAAYFCTRFLAKRSSAMSVKGARASGDLCVLGQINLGKSERIILIRLHERCFLLGVTSHNINVLTELTEEEAAVWLTQAEEAANTPSFLEALRINISKKK